MSGVNLSATVYAWSMSARAARRRPRHSVRPRMHAMEIGAKPPSLWLLWVGARLEQRAEAAGRALLRGDVDGRRARRGARLAKIGAGLWEHEQRGVRVRLRRHPAGGRAARVGSVGRGARD